MFGFFFHAFLCVIKFAISFDDVCGFVDFADVLLLSNESTYRACN